MSVEKKSQETFTTSKAVSTLFSLSRRSVQLKDYTEMIIESSVPIQTDAYSTSKSILIKCFLFHESKWSKVKNYRQFHLVHHYCNNFCYDSFVFSPFNLDPNKNRDDFKVRANYKNTR